MCSINPFLMVLMEKALAMGSVGSRAFLMSNEVEMR